MENAQHNAQHVIKLKVSGYSYYINASVYHYSLGMNNFTQQLLQQVFIWVLCDEVSWEKQGYETQWMLLRNRQSSWEDEDREKIIMM